MKADEVSDAKRTGPRRGLRMLAAAVYVGVTPTKFEEMVSDGRMPKPKRFDGVVVWDLKELDIYFEALPTGTEGKPRRVGFG